MIDSLKNVLKKKGIYIFLLPISWVLHGLASNFGIVPATDALLLALFYCGIAVFLTGLFWLVFRNLRKAGLMTFGLLCIQFYFGPIHDLIKTHLKGSFISGYQFLLPSILISIIAIGIYLKRIKTGFTRVTLYLNTLLTILIVYDSINILLQTVSAKGKPKTESLNIIPCDTCAKPDIYLIVADGYPGNKQLKDLLNYDNYRFENSLLERGFYIDDSSFSNYNFTQYSVASMLSMSYLQGITRVNSNKNDVRISRETIMNNATTSYLENEGYDFYNYSIFDFQNNPSMTIPTFLSRKLEPLTRHTFTYRIKTDLGYHLVTTLKVKSVIRKFLTYDLRNNNQLYAATEKIVYKKSQKPKFIYTHLMMPHHPFFFDSTGVAVPLDSLKDGFYYNKDARISYLKYTNNVLLKLIDHILTNNSTPPIIVLISDHGVREFREKIDPGYTFLNLKAILFPDRDYRAFFRGQSNINLFRTLLNKQFQQKIPMAKDTTILITD